MTSSIRTERLHDSLGPGPGYRVFVDRLWPRGVARKDFHFDVWCKELAPSTELRQWFGHRVERWEEFSRRYREELRAPEQQERIRTLLADAGRKSIVLLYGARDPDHNQAVILAQEIHSHQ